MTLIVRPWAKSSDLLEVSRLFFSGGADEHRNQRKACDIVQVWKTRGKVPHHILSTAALIDAQLHDRMHECNRTTTCCAPSSSVQSKSAVHAMAILSFVTGAADIQQTKEHKVSMFDVAKSIGLPARLVEIRHVIVHEGAPGLAILRKATIEALDWLRSEYWAHVVNERNLK